MLTYMPINILCTAYEQSHLIHLSLYIICVLLKSSPQTDCMWQITLEQKKKLSFLSLNYLKQMNTK